MISSSILAVCSTTRATGSDENEEIVEGAARRSSAEISVVDAPSTEFEIFDVSTLDPSGTSHGVGKLVIGEIGASLMNFSYQILNAESFLFASFSCDKVVKKKRMNSHDLKYKKSFI